jgi:hypothetical protein
MNTLNWHSGFAIGLILLACVSYARFKGPSWVRSYTTAARYCAGLIVYLLSQALMLYVLSAAALSIESVTRLFTESGLTLSELKFLTPIFFAVLLAWVLLLIPQCRQFARWLRHACRRIARSPVEASHLSSVIADADFAPSSELEMTVHSVLVRRGWESNQNWLPVAQPVQELWFKTSLLYQLLRDWESKRKYARFVEDARPEFDLLRKRYDQLSMKIVRTFRTIEGFGTVLAALSQNPGEQTGSSEEGDPAPSPGTEPATTLRTSITDILADVRIDIEFLYEYVCLLIARGVLTNEKTENGRFWRLRDFGFLLEKPSGTPAWIFPAAFGVVFCVMFLTYAVLGTGQTGESALSKAPMIVMIGTMQVVALIVAIVPKQYTGFANIDIDGRTPIKFVLVAGVAAFVLASPVSLLFRSFITLSLGAAFEGMLSSMPWMVMPAATAMATAYLIQDNRWHSIRSEFGRRILDAAFTGISLGLAAAVVRGLFMLMESVFVPDTNRIFVAMFLGVIIGLLVPHSVRDPTYLDNDELKKLARSRATQNTQRRIDGAIAAT